MSKFTLHHGDCLEVLRGLKADSIDAIVTDPPYGLAFMGKRWDYDVPSEDIWRECLRVLKPGGHLLAFAGTRTQHRMAVRIEDAGFEIRDMIAWVYGSGFPKSLDVSKAIDKRRDERHEEALLVTVPMAKAMRAKGLTRRDLNVAVGREANDAGSAQSWTTVVADGAHKPRVPTVEQWTVLRDLLDLACLDDEVCRLNGRKGTPGEAWAKREVVGTKGSTLLAFAPGEGRDCPQVELEVTTAATDEARRWEGWGTALKPALEPITVARKPLIGTVAANVLEHDTGAINVDGCRVGEPEGRWPANLIHDGSEEPTDLLRDAARFFYCAKASKADRGEDNRHPTVKPTDLMRYLCRLVTPAGGVVLDPFTGSGSTGKAAMLEGFRFVGIEREAEYVEIARARIEAAIPEQTSLL